MFSDDSEKVKRGQFRRLAPRFDIQLRTDAPYEFRLPITGWKHASYEQQIAGLDRFDVGTKRLRRRR